MSRIKANVNSRKNTSIPIDEAVSYLRHLRPDGPWQLLAFDPRGPATLRVLIAHQASEVRAFVDRWNNKRNIYYSVNPLREYTGKKATKADISAIEFVHFDLDPRLGETPDDAKKRYRAALADGPELFALIDSGNGLNGLYRLDKPIPLSGDESKDKDVIAEVEARSKALMERLGAKAGTQNIDRILRLPGTTNIPTKTKEKAGRVRCAAKLLTKSDATVSLDELHSAPPEKPKPKSSNVILLPGFRRVRNYPSWMEKDLRQKILSDTDKSSVLHGFLILCIEKGIPYSLVERACLDPKYKGCAIYEDCMEEDDPEAYIERQFERAEDKAEQLEEKSANLDFSNIPLTLDQWKKCDIPPIDPLLGTWLTTTNRVMVSARTGLGKTILLLDLGLAVAAGDHFLHWRGRKRPRKVLYIDGELSIRLVKHRLTLARKRYDKAPTTFHVFCKETCPGLQPLNTDEGQACIEALIRYLGGVDLIIFDNVKHLLTGSHKDEEAWAQIEPWSNDLKRRGIGQIWVHHTGIDTSRGYGDSSREWGLDCTIILEPKGDDRTVIDFRLRFDKARESEPDTRDEYRPMDIRLVDDEWLFEESKGGIRRGIGRLSPAGKIALSALEEVLKEHGRPAPDTNYIPPKATVTTIEAWRSQAYSRGISTSEEPRAKQQAFSRASEQLKAAGIIGIWGDYIWKF